MQGPVSGVQILVEGLLHCDGGFAGLMVTGIYWFGFLGDGEGDGRFARARLRLMTELSCQDEAWPG